MRKIGDEMQFNIKRSLLLEGIQKTLGIVERKTTTPILNNILVKTEGDRIKIAATDREIGLVSYYDAEIISDGIITLSARKTFEMIREIQGDIISFKKGENNWVNITCEKIAYNIPGISGDDFPEADVLGDEEITFFKVKSNMIGEMIDKTFFAMSKEEMRSHLNGAFLETEKKDKGYWMRMVTTDGHRLSLVIFYEEDGEFIDISGGIIIPRKGISEVKKLVDNGSEYIEVGVKKGKCVFKKDDTILRISLVDSEYPEYKKVMPTDKGITVQLDREQFLHSLKRMSVISSEKYSGVKIKIMENKMILNSTNPDVGEANEEIEISYKGEEIEIVYNVSYLIDAVQVISGDSILFDIRPGLRPGVISEVGNDRYICVVMPLKM